MLEENGITPLPMLFSSSVMLFGHVPSSSATHFDQQTVHLQSDIVEEIDRDRWTSDSNGNEWHESGLDEDNNGYESVSSIEQEILDELTSSSSSMEWDDEPIMTINDWDDTENDTESSDEDEGDICFEDGTDLVQGISSSFSSTHPMDSLLESLERQDSIDQLMTCIKARDQEQLLKVESFRNGEPIKNIKIFRQMLQIEDNGDRVLEDQQDELIQR